MPRRRIAVGLLAIGLATGLATGLLAGCEPPHACTLIGAEDGVSFRLDPALAARLPATGTVEVRMCADGRCTDLQTDAAGIPPGRARWFQPIDLGDAARSVQLSLLVTDARGRHLVDAAGTAVTRRVQPNGPGCEPVVWQASARAVGSTLVADR